MGGLLKKIQNAMLGAQFEDEEDSLDYIDEEYEEREYVPKTEREKTDLPINRAAKKPASKESNLLTMPNAAIFENNVVICKPKSVDDASGICRQFRESCICIVSLEGLENMEAQRIADVLSGAAFVLDGIIERITNSVFVMAPIGYRVSSELREQIKSGSSFLPWLLSGQK